MLNSLCFATLFLFQCSLCCPSDNLHIFVGEHLSSCKSTYEVFNSGYFWGLYYVEYSWKVPTCCHNKKVSMNGHRCKENSGMMYFIRSKYCGDTIESCSLVANLANNKCFWSCNWGWDSLT
ncbi:hypothetical protein GYH30_019563 [Glycine max]|uniref:Prolamin-like domain-containing protein n=2 Tax=Glycine subgen. Soja TaxID=1462606 RepID=K7L3T7_SOYBN|nr:hypothetical protein GYH30_019563 [Glycine max]RZC04632.1 hypothetical protein D0Y65_018971 [Glycine soja]